MVVVFLHEIVGKDLQELLDQVMIAPQRFFFDTIPVYVHWFFYITVKVGLFAWTEKVNNVPPILFP
jgi:hypothetical protein